MTIKVNFSCAYTFFFVPLQRKRKFADILKALINAFNMSANLRLRCKGTTKNANVQV